MTKCKNCWEYFNCSKEVKENCIVFKTNSGEECWMLSEIEPRHLKSPKIRNKCKYCWDCNFFNEKNSNYFNQSA